MQTFLQFKERLRAEIWPTGEARRLRLSHDPFFNEAMMDIQRWVDCYRQYHTATFDFSTTQWDDAKTVVDAPYGKIRRVYTVAGGEDRWRDKVRYKSSTFDEINCWSNNLFASATPTSTPVLSLGVRTADVSQDSAFGRARVGIWAIDRRKLYVAPYIQSTELLVVDWDGTKTKWLDSDGVDELIWGEAEIAIKTYVQWRHEMCFGDNKNYARELKDDYASMLADLIHFCRENTAQQSDQVCNSDGGGAELSNLNQDDIDDDDESNDPDTTEQDRVLFDFVADIEDTTEGETLAARVQADNPEFLVSGGDNGYAEDHSNSFGDAFGSLYSWAKTAGIVIPVIGNHEWISGSYQLYLDYFATELAGKNNGRFYEFTHGSVHGFVENRDANEPDGFSNASIQAEWLITKATLSPARWKFAFGHHPPYSSDSTYGSNTALQRAYSGAGIQCVFSGHAHVAEHIIVDGVHYFNCGLGGRSRYAFGAPITGSQFRYNAKETRIRVTLDCDTCLIEFVNSDDVVVYSFTITHA